jgi:hypothetical protein
VGRAHHPGVRPIQAYVPCLALVVLCLVSFAIQPFAQPTPGGCPGPVSPAGPACACPPMTTYNVVGPILAVAGIAAGAGVYLCRRSERQPAVENPDL